MNKNIEKLFFSVLGVLIAAWCSWVSASVVEGLTAMQILERIESRIIKIESKIFKVYKDN